MKQYELHYGHVIDALNRLAAGSVRTVVTSIPFYGLRDYQTAPQVWDGDPACPHDWRGHGVKHYAPRRDHDGRDFGPTRNQEPTRAATGKPIPLGATCDRCGAWLGELGQEPSLSLYTAHVVQVFAAVKRVLAPDGTLWLNVGDSYSNAGQSGNDRRAGQANGGKAHYTPTEGRGEKQLLGVPWRVAFALQDAGWILRNDIIWAKPAPMPESVTDRCTKAHEYLFLFSQQPDYYCDMAAIAEATTNSHGSGNGYARGARLSYQNGDGTPRGSDAPWQPAATRNRRDVWTIPYDPCDWEYCLACSTFYEGTARRRIWYTTDPATGAKVQHCPACEATDAWVDHYAMWPPALPALCIRAGSRPGDTVLDPFVGSGTTVRVAVEWGRVGVGIDLNPAFIQLADTMTARQPVQLPALVGPSVPRPEQAALVFTAPPPGGRGEG